jgi:radical SAM protein with 4Fe4S-binding SPASM domain
MTTLDGDGRCFFERLCENYDRDGQPGLERFKWALLTRLINLGLRRARLDRETMKKKLFHHPPTARALALTARSVAHYGLTTPQRFVAPLFVVWNFTQACNLRCRHCYQSATPKPARDELSLEERLNLVDQMADAGVPFLAIAGGEPMVCPDLWPTLERARRRGLQLNLATNGTLLTPENVARLKECGVTYVEVSVDSLEEAEHDAFRGQRGSWARSIQGIRNSVAGGMRTGLAACFTRDTVDRADAAVRFAIDLGCQTFSHFNFIPVGRGRDMVHEDLTPGQRELLMRVLARHLQENRINVISTAPQFGRSCVVYGSQDGVFATGHAGRGEGAKTMVLSRYIGGCGAGRCYCCVQPNGVVTPCVYMSSQPVGHLRRHSLLQIWDNPLFDVLADREDRGDHCGVCDYRTYCGGCRARSLAYTGDVTAGDPGCSFNHHVWDEMASSAPERTHEPSLVALHSVLHDGGDLRRLEMPAVEAPGSSLSEEPARAGLRGR